MRTALLGCRAARWSAPRRAARLTVARDRLRRGHYQGRSFLGPERGRNRGQERGGEPDRPAGARRQGELREHKLHTGRGGSDLVFGRTADEPFFASTVRTRALEAWGWKQVRKDGCTTWVKAREDA